MITLVGGYIQGPSGLPVPNGSLSLQLNVDSSIIAYPFGLVMANKVVTLQFDANGNLLPNSQIWSNAELQPQNSVGLGTYYLATVYDQNGGRVNKVPLWWQFPNADGSTVDISSMVPFATVGGNVIFYPTLFSGNFTFSGNPAFIGAPTFAENNATVFVDGVKNKTIAQAIASLPASGGTVVCPDNYRETITSQITLGSSTSAVILQLGMNVLITVNITDGTSDAFLVNSGSGIVGTVPFSNSSRANGSVIQLAGTANLANIIHAKPVSGGEFIRLERFQVDGLGSSGTSVVTNAHIFIDDLFDQGILKDVSITQIARNSIGWLVQGTSTTDGPFVLDGCWATGDANTGARPLVVRTNSTHGVHSVAIKGGGYVGPGSGFPAIEVNGNGNTNNVINTILFDSVYAEDFTNTPATAWKLTDVSNVTFVNCSCGLAANAASVGIDISQSTTGLTRGIQVVGFYPGSSACIGINNHISGEQIGTSTIVIASYYFGQADPSGARATIGPIFSNPQSMQVGQYKQAANNLADLVIIPAFPASRKPLLIANFSDNAMNVDLDSGATTTQETRLRFLDQGIAEWEIRKSNGNGLSVHDLVNNLTWLAFTQNGNTNLNSGAGANGVEVNQTPNSGTSGLVIYSGGATPVVVGGIVPTVGLTLNNAAGTQSTTSLSPSGSATFRNFADSSLAITLDSGATTTEEAAIFLRDQGTNEWRIRKTSSNSLAIQDDVNSIVRLNFPQTAAVAAGGILRLANTETINFRNAANNADLLIGFNSSNVFETSGVTGFGNGSSGTAVTTTTKGSGTGPANPQLVVAYEEVVINGTTYYRALFQ